MYQLWRPRLETQQAWVGKDTQSNAGRNPGTRVTISGAMPWSAGLAPSSLQPGAATDGGWFLVSSRSEPPSPGFLLSAPTHLSKAHGWALGVLGLTPDLTMVGTMGRGSQVVRGCLRGKGGQAWLGRLYLPPASQNSGLQSGLSASTSLLHKAPAR